MFRIIYDVNLVFLFELSDKMAEVTRELKQIKEDIEKLEIKALESRKIYHKKLKQEFGDDAKDEKSNSNPVLLPEP